MPPGQKGTTPQPGREPSEKPGGLEAPEGDTRIEKESGPQIPIVLNAKVRWFIRYFTGPNRETFARWLERSGRYEIVVRRILKEEGVPEDLFYIALIESGFNPKAYSWAGASGVWQFMRSTARKYGLVVNWWIDERRDPIKATHAAARYFKDLHGTFRSWYLAQAGYNAGEGRIRRGLRRLKRKDFWTLAKTRYIGRETRNFVPKFVAASIVARDPEAYGFRNLSYEEPLQYEEVPVSRSTDLRWLASAAGFSMTEIQRLNPELRRWKTPPNYPGYKIKVPPGTARRVADAIGRWKPRLFAGRKYRVQNGDTLGDIARNLKTTVEILADLNGIQEPGRIFIGQEILFPADGGADVDSSSVTDGKKGPHNPKGPYHIVRSGDSLWKISRRFNVSIEDIQVWNRLSKGARLYPGDKIRVIPIPKERLAPKSNESERPSSP